MSMRTIPRAFLSVAAFAMSRLSWRGVTDLIIPIFTLAFLHPRVATIELVHADVIGHAGRHQVIDRSSSREAIADLVGSDGGRVEMDDPGARGRKAQLVQGLRRERGLGAVGDHEARLIEQRIGVMPGADRERGIGSDEEREALPRILARER